MVEDAGVRWWTGSVGSREGVSHTSPFSLTFSSSYASVSIDIWSRTNPLLPTLYGAYHFASRVFPLNRELSAGYARGELELSCQGR
jgi:hypothetical protein